VAVTPGSSWFDNRRLDGITGMGICCSVLYSIYSVGQGQQFDRSRDRGLEPTCGAIVQCHCCGGQTGNQHASRAWADANTRSRDLVWQFGRESGRCWCQVSDVIVIVVLLVEVASKIEKGILSRSLPSIYTPTGGHIRSQFQIILFCFILSYTCQYNVKIMPILKGNIVYIICMSLVHIIVI
jgi:hypothetical protein